MDIDRIKKQIREKSALALRRRTNAYSRTRPWWRKTWPASSKKTETGSGVRWQEWKPDRENGIGPAAPRGILHTGHDREDSGRAGNKSCAAVMLRSRPRRRPRQRIHEQERKRLRRHWLRARIEKSSAPTPRRLHESTRSGSHRFWGVGPGKPKRTQGKGIEPRAIHHTGTEKRDRETDTRSSEIKRKKRAVKTRCKNWFFL
jgi:hypothetical protein